MKRNKSDLGAGVFDDQDAIDASGITDNFDAWNDDLPLLYALQSDADLAEDYLGKITDHWNTVDGENTSNGSGYDDAKDTPDTGSAALAAVTAEKLSDWNDALLLKANAEALHAALVTAYAKQEVELAKETLVYQLAVDAKEAQDDLVEDLTEAQGLASEAKEAADGTLGEMQEAQREAQENYDTHNDNAVANAAAAVETPLEELNGLRETSLELDESLQEATEAYSDQENLVSSKEEEVKEALALKMAAIVACKGEKYDEYWNTWQQALDDREEALVTIEDLLTDQVIPERGNEGWRCEKALSNGNWSAARDDTTCADGLCCGAAKIPQGNVVMTIETCQKADTTEFKWGRARGPMETTWPETTAYPFTCIDGAQKLAAAASALAAAVYMLA